MTKDVIISIQGLQHAVTDDEEVPVEVISFGEYHKRGGKHYLVYEEPEEGSTQATKCRIKFSEEGLEMSKKGVNNAKMVFVPGEEYVSCYQTPYGGLTLGMNTKSLELQEEEDFLRAELVYGLMVNSSLLADCTLVLKVEPRKK